ncbi:amidase-like protein [Hypoxylon sp. FL1150]|nr:amidase-like protein [Hypoxylon sp. FL1150]
MCSDRSPVNEAIDTSLPQTTTVIQISSQAFAVQGHPDHAIKLTESPDLDCLTCFIPATSFSVKDEKRAPLKDYLENEYNTYLQDDVFSPEFLKYVLLVSDEVCISESVRDLLASWGCLFVFTVPPSHPQVQQISRGPYFFSSRGLFPAWGIYPDSKEAFVLSTIPSQKKSYTYENLNAAAFGSSSVCVAVPSRLKFSRSEEFPLAGMRIAVKDLFHLKGVHTGCGNRAYRTLHEAAETSSVDVERAVRLGATVVGKTKTVEFGGSQEVIGDWSDYFYPFNARGDGYLASTGSSTGSASALAAYPWLDIALGTDAGGSIRDPAVAHGIYGLRPTHHGQAISDVVIPCGIFHTTGFLGRDSEDMLLFGQQWFEYQRLSPSRILFPKEYFADHEGVQKLAVEWVTSLASWLGARKDDVSIEDVWDATKPPSEPETFFNTFNKAFIDLICTEFWTYLGEFRREYRRKFGSAPYVCKVTEWLWKQGKTMPDFQRQDALDKVRLHNEWFFEHFFNDQQAIIVIPRYKLDYRDEYLPPPESRGFDGFDSNLHASFAGVPNIIVPIGQCSFHSKITERDELFPVSLSIIAPKGQDVGLLSLVHDYLRDNGLPTSVLTGRTAF